MMTTMMMMVVMMSLTTYCIANPSGPPGPRPKPKASRSSEVLSSPGRKILVSPQLHLGILKQSRAPAEPRGFDTGRPRASAPSSAAADVAIHARCRWNAPRAQTIRNAHSCQYDQLAHDNRASQHRTQHSHSQGPSVRWGTPAKTNASVAKTNVSMRDVDGLATSPSNSTSARCQRQAPTPSSIAADATVHARCSWIAPHAQTARCGPPPVTKDIGRINFGVEREHSLCNRVAR